MAFSPVFTSQHLGDSLICLPRLILNSKCLLPFTYCLPEIQFGIVLIVCGAKEILLRLSKHSFLFRERDEMILQNSSLTVLKENVFA